MGIPVARAREDTLDKAPAGRPVQAYRTARYPVELGIVFVAYFLGGKIGLAIPFTSGNVSPVWPPAGIALAAVLVAGYRIWPAVAIGAFLVNFFTPIPPVAALGIAVGNTLGPLTGAWLLQRIPQFHRSLARLKNVLWLIVLAALGGTAISATIGTFVLFVEHVNAWSTFGAAWQVWWLGDAMGVLIVTPLILTAAKLTSIRQSRQLLELAAVLLSTAVSCMLIFDRRIGFPAGEDVLAFGVFPLVAWSAVRFGPGGASVVSFLISAIAVWQTAHGFGPFVKGAPLQNATLLQSFLAVLSMSGMTLAAAITERAQLIREQTARESLEQSERHYRGIVETARRAETERQSALQTIMLLSRAVEQTADSVLITNREGTIEYVNPAFEATTGYTREEAIGKTPRILKSGQHDPGFYKMLWDTVLKGETFLGTLANRKKTGEIYWAEQTITPIKDQAGNIPHFVSVLKDVTQLRKMQEREVQLRLAREVQQRFYATAISASGFDIAGAAYPAEETGGDYFDFFRMPDGCVCVCVGDVSGHGFDAALVMALTRAYVRSFAEVESDVGKILTRVNRMLVADLDDLRFVTLLLVRLDPCNGSLAYASAGHVPGFQLNVSGEIDAEMGSTGPPLGVLGNVEFVDTILPLKPRQLLLLLTDGVTETAASDGEEFGPGRVLDYVQAHRKDPACQIADGICRAAQCFARGEHQFDDRTSVVVKVG